MRVRLPRAALLATEPLDPLEPLGLGVAASRERLRDPRGPVQTQAAARPAADLRGQASDPRLRISTHGDLLWCVLGRASRSARRDAAAWLGARGRATARICIRG